MKINFLNQGLKKILLIVMVFLLFTGCSLENKNGIETEKKQVQKSEMEVESNVMITDSEEEVPEEISQEGIVLVSEPDYEETTEGYDLNIISVESEIMRKFLEGEGEAVFSESFISICSEWDLEYCYEGAIDEIVMGYYENSVQFINNQKLSDLVVNAKEVFLETMKYLYMFG